jgi:hypothetical protein
VTGARAALAALLVTGCAAARPERAIVGTWRVVAVENRDSVTGRWRPLFGDAPAGYAVYAADGTHLLQFGRTPVAPFAAGTDRGGTDAEVRAAFFDHFAWHGRWRVDAARGTIIHDIEGSPWPSWRATTQERRYRLAGDTLVLGDTTRTRRVFVRVRR